MAEEDISGVKKEPIKKDLIQEIRSISQDEATKRRISNGVFGEAELVKGSILAIIVKAIDDIEKKIDSELATSSKLAELEAQMKTEDQLIKGSLRELNVRIIENMSKNFEVQRRAIDNIPLPLERAIIEIPRNLKSEVQEIKSASEKLGTDLLEVGKLNLELHKSLEDMHKTMKDFSDGLRTFHETLDLQKNRIDEMGQNMQSKMDKMSVSVDEKTTILAEKVQQSMAKMDSFDSWLVAFSSSIDGVEPKFSDLNKKIANMQTELDERIEKIEKSIEDDRSSHKENYAEILKKLEILGSTIIGIEALDEFVKDIETKIETTKVDITGIEKDVGEIKTKMDFDTVVNSVNDMQAKFDSQANTIATLLTKETPTIDTKRIEEAISDIRDEIREVNKKHTKSLADIQSKINALSRSVEMKD